LTLDRAQLTANLHSFYDFQGKIVLCVGAGGGQLLDQSVVTAETVLIDRTLPSLASRNRRSGTNDMQGSIRNVLADFNDVNIPGDVVYFEFCLHEMDDPRRAIDHAQTLASDVVIFEHSPGSAWVFYSGEEEKVRRSAEAVASFTVRRCQTVHAKQVFKDHSQLVAKLSTQAELAIHRAGRYAGATDIVIPMKCDLVLI
jgi:hypothetical protein